MKTQLLTVSLLAFFFASVVACSPIEDQALHAETAHSYKRFVAKASIEPPLYGVADTNGKWVVEPKYLEINIYKSGAGIYAVQETNAKVNQELYQLINDDNKLVADDIKSDNFFPILNGYIAIRDPDRAAHLGKSKSDIGWRNYGWSIIDKHGNVALPGPYKSIEPQGEYAILTGESGSKYIIDSSARITYETPESVYIGKRLNDIDDLFVATDYSQCFGVRNYDKCRKEGVVNHRGEWVIQPQGNFSITWCREQPSLLCIAADYTLKHRLYWLIDKDWNTLSPGYGAIFPTQSKHNGEVKWGHYFAVNNRAQEQIGKSNYGYQYLITDKGVQVPNSEYHITSTVVNDRVAIFNKNGKDVLIDIKNGSALKTATHIYGYKGSANIGIFAEEQKSGTKAFSGFIDIEGKPIGRQTYEDIMSFQDGVFAVKKNGLWGFVDNNFNEVIGHRFKTYKGWFMLFHGGLAVVSPKENEGQFGIINKSGNYVVPPGKYVDILYWID